MLQDYEIPNYSLHHVNLDTEVGRGLAIYSHSSLANSINQIDLNLSFEEVCLLEVCLRGGDVLLLGSCYRSPAQTPTSDGNNEKLHRLLRTVCKKNYSHRCIIGDFNFRDINWSSWTTNHNEESTEAKFIEKIRDCYLHQHVEKVKRKRGNDNPSLIVFTDEEMQVSELVQHPPLVAIILRATWTTLMLCVYQR